MLADDWGVPRCEADERGGVVLACLVEPCGVLGIVVSGRAVADTFTNFSARRTLSFPDEVGVTPMNDRRSRIVVGNQGRTQGRRLERTAIRKTTRVQKV